MRKKILITAGILTAVIALLFISKIGSRKEALMNLAEVKSGIFEITVSNSGELLAEKAIDVMGPTLGRQPEQSNQNQNMNRNAQGGGNQGNRGASGTTSTGTASAGTTSLGTTASTGGSRGGSTGGGGGFSSGMGGMSMGGGMQAGGMSNIRMMDFKIQDMVPEGTIVKAGDYIAQLDKTSYDNTLRDAVTALTTARNNYEMKILDTAVTMTNLRDGIKNQVYVVEEAKINLDQSQFEPPATIRKAEMRLDREIRSLEQLRKTFELKKAQIYADILKMKVAYDIQERTVTDLQNFLNDFTIKAPIDGMVLYKKEHNGSKRKSGSSINAFDNVVATLPDLSSMQSKMYVNEVEVSKLQKGLPVQVTVDAFPNRQYKGKIISIGNVGEVLPNSDAKMFEVIVALDGSDYDLRPGMTTWNKVMLKSFDNVVYIPLECVQAGIDSIPYVYKKNGTKQVVVLGEVNDKNIIVKKGLEPGQLIYSIPPAEAADFRLVGKELISEAKIR